VRITQLKAELQQAKLATRKLMGEVEKMRWELDEALRRVRELEQSTRATS
jgi:hypothetical protein